MKLERRIFDLTEVRVERDADKPTVLEGYAAMFRRDSLDLGGFIEQIEPGAFSRSIRAAKDNPVDDMIHAYWNHNSDYVLASTRSGLVLTEDEKGLRFRFPAQRLTPQQLDAVQAGDMRMSFGFYVSKEGQRWSPGGPGQPDRRQILDATLMEVSPVSKPAYPSTTVSARDVEGAKHDHDEWKKTQNTPAPTPEPNDLQKFKDRAAVVKAKL